MEQGSTSSSASNNGGYMISTFNPKYKIFLSHSTAQKGFVEQLCVDLERCDRYPFRDKPKECLSIGTDFSIHIVEAIEQCEIGVVILSEEFFTSKWPMLELVAMINVKKRNPSFTIMPVLLGITLSQCRDVNNHKKWVSTWHVWARSDSEIVVDDCESTLQLFGRTNALKYDSESGEVKFREEILEAICKLVPADTRFEDSHIQGRSRLCKVIHDKIKASTMPRLDGVRVVGLYGVGGIGKTTICKIMCNDLSKEYRGKVAHVELESRSEDELLKEVLRRLTSTKAQNLGAMNVDECRHRLMRDMVNVGVFLAIDNVSSTTAKQALTLLGAHYGPGSVVLVTARSLNDLISLKLSENQCMEMPELEMEEAKSLFLYHAACVPSAYSNNKEDDELISACVQQCWFGKDGGIRYHYHPLALRTLGEQFDRVGYVPERWWALLREINFFNPFGELKNPVFSILRKSFDALNAQDQLLFMDAALFVPYSIASYDFDIGYKWNVFDWFGMVHGIPVNTVIERLGNLKAKSLLENLGDGFSRIGMHDLWREFAKLETKVGYFERRRWIFEWDEYNVHDEGHVTSRGASWVNLRRMYFLEMGFMKLEDVNFDCFPNVTVLKLSRNNKSPLVLDVSSLKQLRSLELEVKEELLCRPYQRRPVTSVGLVGLGLLSKLGFLRWSNIPSDSSCIDEIGRLTNLQVLDLSGKGRLPDVSNLVLLRVACFRQNRAAEVITGLGSKHTNLRYLDFRGCGELRSCPGVSELVALQELRLTNCGKLEEVPNLQKLKRLVILRVDGCHLITALPGLNELVNLQELNTFSCENLSELPGMENHRNLRVLDVGWCRSLTSLPGLEELVTLQSLDTRGCSSLIQWPDMRKLTNLQCLKLDSNPPLQSTAGLSDLISLRTLFGGFCDAQDWPDLRNLTNLEVLLITGWPAQVLPNLADFVRLESITLYACRKARVLPDLQRLTRVNKLYFRYCEFEDMSGLSNVISLKDLTIMDCEKLETVPDLGSLARLESLTVERCARLRDFRGILALRNLRILWAKGHPWLHENLGPDLGRLTGLMHLDVSDGGFADLQWLADFSHMRTLKCRGCPVQELPDLAKFPELHRLDVSNCVNLTKLTCTGTLNANFSFLEIEGCRRLTSLPDLSNSRDMRQLHVANSGVVMSLEAIQEVKNRWPDIDFVTELADSQTDEPAHAQTAALPFRQPVLARFVFSMVRCCAGRELWIRAA